MVGEGHNGLPLGLVAHLRTAEDYFDAGANALDGGDDFMGRRYIPDVYAKADDFRVTREQRLGDVERAKVYIKFRDDGARLEFAKVGE